MRWGYMKQDGGYEFSLHLRARAILRPLENSLVHVSSKLHSKPCMHINTKNVLHFLSNFFCIVGPLCRETRYDPATHVCCCGKLYEKKVGYECCGLRYYDTRRQKCCNEKRSVLVERRFLWRNGGRCPS